MSDPTSPSEPRVGAHPLDDGFPAFARDIDATLSVTAHYVLWGNVRERFFLPGPDGHVEPGDIVELLWQVLTRAGYEVVLVFDPVDRVQVLPATDEAIAVARDVLGSGLDPAGASPLEQLRGVLEAAHASPRRVAVVIDYASRLVSDAEHLQADELDFFRFCEKASQTATPRRSPTAGRHRLMNAVVWVLDRDRDLPSWFTAGNGSVRLVPVPSPSIRDRLRAAEAVASSIVELADLDEGARSAFVQTFAGASEGLTVRAMGEVLTLARDRGIGFEHIDDAVRAYRVGMVDNPWRDDALAARVRTGARSLSRHVLGQPAAVAASLDVLKRSVLGVGAAQSRGHAARPRGVLFFAGPTGVGKTELAKCIADLAFGDRDAYLRFDMSEFSAEHSDARLIGAPPGYTGFDAGGELTNGVRQQPFRLLLFDEIEKAHPRILDKFLQILDDGRLTDGRGSTVFFSETFIVFTSNLGIYVPSDDLGTRRWVPNPEVDPSLDHPALESAIRAAIATHFTETLNRPELLNRIGMENLVVFDFIRPDVAEAIFDANLERLVAGLRKELGVQVSVEPEAQRALRSRCTADLSHGGRGIENQIRARLVNPLSRAMFDLDPIPGQVTVAAVEEGPAAGVRLR